MASSIARVASLALLVATPIAATCFAQSPDVPASIVTPEVTATQLGDLEFPKGVPTEQTATISYDLLDFTYAYRAFTDSMRGVSIAAIRQGLQEAGVKDGEVLIFSDLMDSNSLFLTANCDTIYAMGSLDMTQGPMVIEAPPQFLGTVQDAWFRWVIDLGLPGPDRGEGGKYLILPPDYQGSMPQGEFNVAHAKTNTVVWFGRSYLQDGNDPKPVVKTIRDTLKIYPYEPGGVGTSIADFLAGKAPLAPVKQPPTTVFHEGSGKKLNTIPPTDASYFDLLNEVVQREPATSLDAELMGPIAAIGIKKGQPFQPDERMKGILAEAAVMANASSRTIFTKPRHADWYYYADSVWYNWLFVTGYQFETPIPEITKEGVKPFPPTGYRTMDGRTAFFYGVTGITPAMAMRLPGVGSQYLMALVDADQQYFDGAKTYKVTLPKDVPAEKFWSLTLYDLQTRSMLATPQRFPRAGSQDYPSPAAQPNADGSTTVYIGPEQPKGIARGNWIQTDPKKGWFVILRLYSPLQPFFTKDWRPSEFEVIK